MSACRRLASAAGALGSGVMTRGGRRLGAWMACVTIPLVVVASDYVLLTQAGRRALEKYLDHMDAIIRAARK